MHCLDPGILLTRILKDKQDPKAKCLGLACGVRDSLAAAQTPPRGHGLGDGQGISKYGKLNSVLC